MTNALSVSNFMTPSHFEMVVKQADVLVKSGFLPASIKTPQQAIAIIMAGYELGIQPWQALTTINVIQGKPSISPQLMLALIQRSGQVEDIAIDGDENMCTVSMKRKGQSVHTETFTMEDAVRMQLAGKDNWKKQPGTMLKWRAVAACARVVFPDAILGLYTPEEMGADVRVEGDEQIVIVAPVEEPPIVNVQIDGETGEIIDEFADLRSQLEEAGIRDINSIKAINGSGVVRITTRANHAAVLPGMLQAVELKAAKIGERYFDLPVSV